MERVQRNRSHRSTRLEEEFSSSLVESMNVLEEIWHAVGISEDQKNKRERTMLLHFQNLLKEMVAEEESLRNSLKAKNEECRKELEQLCTDLGVPMFKLEQELDLLHTKAKLREKHDTLKKDKEERLSALRSLRSQEEALCTRLALPQHELNFIGCPRADQLKELETNLLFLNQEIDKRSTLFTKLQSGIVRFWEDLEVKPESDLESQLLLQDAATQFVLSKDNLDTLNTMQLKLEEQYKELLANIDSLREKLLCLWNRLDVSRDDRQVFNVKNSGYKPSVALALTAEIEKLEEQKKQHLEKFICGIRKELHLWWDKCFYGEEKRKEFQPAFKDEFTEDSLVSHEHYCQVMKNFYEENKTIFKKVEKREGIWKKKLEFEERETDSNRLHNRGGALLKEEKIRRLLEKELPKIEQELSSLVESWETEHETYFMVGGMRYADHVADQRERFEQIKEEKRQLRQQAKQDTILGDVTHNGMKTTTPQKRRFVGTPVRIVTKQRKVDITMTPGKFIHSSICPSPHSVRMPLKENNCAATPKQPTSSTMKSNQPRRSARLRNTRRVLSDKNATISGRVGASNHSRRRIATPHRVQQQRAKTALRNPVTDVSLISYSEFAGGVASDSRSSFVASGRDSAYV